MSIFSIAAQRPIRRGDKGDAVAAVQLALRADHHEVLVDSDFGNVTRLAVKDLQFAHKLRQVDGIVGIDTARILDAILDRPRSPIVGLEPLPSTMTVAPWLSVLRAITGTKEVLGKGDSPVILDMVRVIVEAYPELRGTVGWYNHDSIPWCGLGMGYGLVRAGKKPPKLLLGAANFYEDWPESDHLREPCLGAIGVKSRAGGHHVFAYEGESATHYWARGCNQSDAVNVSKIAKDSSILGFVWPKGEPRPGGGRIFNTFAGASSGSEA